MAEMCEAAGEERIWVAAAEKEVVVMRGSRQAPP